jgi:RNA polymerase sigma factor (TIGR02999 family)
MNESPQHSVTRLLAEVRAGNKSAFDALLPLVYGELHQIAANQRRHWEGDETLNTTALVHEAYLRLVDQTSPEWNNRPHFLAVAATAMRQILLDYAKRKRAAKREGGRRHVRLEDAEHVLNGSADLSFAQSESLIALEDALCRLQRHDSRLSRIVECRFYGGMTIEDTAEALAISPASVKRGWAMAQAWLYRELRHSAQTA